MSIALFVQCKCLIFFCKFLLIVCECNIFFFHSEDIIFRKTLNKPYKYESLLYFKIFFLSVSIDSM